MVVPISHFVCAERDDTPGKNFTSLDVTLFGLPLIVGAILYILSYELGPAACYVSYACFSVSGVVVVLYLALAVKKCGSACEEADAYDQVPLTFQTPQSVPFEPIQSVQLEPIFLTTQQRENPPPRYGWKDYRGGPGGYVIT